MSELALLAIISGIWALQLEMRLGVHWAQLFWGLVSLTLTVAYVVSLAT